MTLKECYSAMGADYDGVLGRLKSERLIQKFVLKFLDDGSYKLLQDSLANGNDEEAFRASHTIKGMCQNLGFTNLEHSSSELTEVLRGNGSGDVQLLFEKVKSDYEDTVGAITAFKAGLGD